MYYFYGQEEVKHTQRCNYISWRQPRDSLVKICRLYLCQQHKGCYEQVYLIHYESLVIETERNSLRGKKKKRKKLTWSVSLVAFCYFKKYSLDKVKIEIIGPQKYVFINDNKDRTRHRNNAWETTEFSFHLFFFLSS